MLEQYMSSWDLLSIFYLLNCVLTRSSRQSNISFMADVVAFFLSAIFWGLFALWLTSWCD